MARNPEPAHPEPKAKERPVFDNYPDRPWSEAADARYVTDDEIAAAKIAEEETTDA